MSDVYDLQDRIGRMLAVSDARPTAADEAVFDEVMAEIDAADESDDDLLARLQDPVASINARVDAEAQRLDEDAYEASLTRRERGSTEDVIARARMVTGTYGPGGFVTGTCGGEPDDFGRCSSPHHYAGCEQFMSHAAATGSPEEADAWVRAVNNAAPGVLHRAAPGADAAAELMGGLQ